MNSSVYDSFAFLLRSILNHANKDIFTAYLCMSPAKSMELNGTLSACFPEIFNSENISMILTPHYFERKDVIHRLYSFIKSCILRNDLFPLIRLASKLDTALANCVTGFNTDYEQISGLNSNNKELQLQLLPRCHCKWAHVNRDKHCSCDLNIFLEHFYYVDTKDLYERVKCSVSHVFLPSSVFNRAKEKGYLTVGISALSDQIRLNSVLTDDGEKCSFIVKSISDIDLLVKNVTAIQKRAQQKEVDILCFPEMLGHPKVNEALCDKLEEYPDSGQAENPALIICPTYWNSHANKAVVLDNVGERIITQAKQIPYPLPHQGRQYMEDIRPDHHIHLIHCEGIGRMAVMICKDAIEREFLFHLISTLKITLLFVPAFSTGFYDFEENLKFCSAFDCTAVWINCCSVCRLSEKAYLEKVGFIFKAGKKSQYTDGDFYFTHDDCTKEKAGGCHNCLYIQRICFNS